MIKGGRVKDKGQLDQMVGIYAFEEGEKVVNGKDGTEILRNWEIRCGQVGFTTSSG